MSKHSEQPTVSSELPWLHQEVIGPQFKSVAMVRRNGRVSVYADGHLLEDTWEQAAHQASKEPEERGG